MLVIAAVSTEMAAAKTPVVMSSMKSTPSGFTFEDVKNKSSLAALENNPHASIQTLQKEWNKAEYKTEEEIAQATKLQFLKIYPLGTNVLQVVEELRSIGCNITEFRDQSMLENRFQCAYYFKMTMPDEYARQWYKGEDIEQIRKEHGLYLFVSWLITLTVSENKISDVYVRFQIEP